MFFIVPYFVVELWWWIGIVVEASGTPIRLNLCCLFFVVEVLLSLLMMLPCFVLFCSKRHVQSAVSTRYRLVLSAEMCKERRLLPIIWIYVFHVIRGMKYFVYNPEICWQEENRKDHTEWHQSTLRRGIFNISTSPPDPSIKFWST